MSPDVVDECVFAILETTERVECEHGAMYALFNRNRDRLMEECPDFVQTVLKQLNGAEFQESYQY